MRALPKRYLVSHPRCVFLLLAVYLFSTTLPGCGPSQRFYQPAASPAATALSKSNPDSAPAFKPNPAGEADISGIMHVQLHGVWLYDGYVAPQPEIALQIPGGIDCGSVLVLSSNNLTYISAQLQNIRGYIGGFSPDVNPSVYPLAPDDLSDVPSELQWVQGLPNGSCAGETEVTNIGDTPLQIDKAGVSLTDVPAVNNYSYRLIDKCSILDNCMPSGGQGGPACIYYADIQLGAGRPSTTYRAPLSSNQAVLTSDGFDFTCPMPMLIELGHVADVMLRFILSAEVTTGAAYQVTPFVSLSTLNGGTVVSLPTLNSTLVFAAPHHYSCYSLHGDMFVPETRVNLLHDFTYEDDATRTEVACV
jgi:hypothetical protein